MSKFESSIDVEQKPLDDERLRNNVVATFEWQDVNVRVQDRVSKRPRYILEGSSGFVEAGEVLALMGPSGSGKTTLLNVLARRQASRKAEVGGDVYVDGQSPSLGDFRKLTSYVEQDDALIGSLTVEETLSFAARLSLPSNVSAADRRRLVQHLIHSFGLQSSAQSIIGTPIRKGISGGQKRRVSVASQLITAPRILFLDEPTSGLDSAASFEVMSFIRDVARQYKLIVVASIHQPSTTTFNLFDKLLLLSEGRTCYFGPTQAVVPFFEAGNLPIPVHMNPAEFLLDLVNVDFAIDKGAAEAQLRAIQDRWTNSTNAAQLTKTVQYYQRNAPQTKSFSVDGSSSNKFLVPFVLLHRSFIKSYRDVVVYGIRIAMYLGLAIMMGTVWLRLPQTQDAIQPFINAIFFGSAFMSFMAVAYVPAFLEDRAMFVKERANGLYGPTSFMLANFLIGLPYLFLISVLFSVISYWLSNMVPSATAFFTWIMWLFLDLVAAESLVVLVSSIFPNFVVALALIAFANGLWMSVGGFLVSPTVLNVFWRYVFHYIDYQTYVFQGMMVNEFSRRTYSCGSGCHCMYQSSLASQCRIDGHAVLEQYEYATGRTGKWVGIMIGIIAVYRFLGWGITWFRRT